MDTETELAIQKSLERLEKGRTVISIAHRLSTIKDADKIFVINDGNVEAEGTHGELLSNCELYKKMWEAHSMVKDEAEDKTNDASGKETVYA